MGHDLLAIEELQSRIDDHGNDDPVEESPENRQAKNNRRTEMAARLTMAVEPSVMYRQRGIKAMWLIHFLNRARQAT